MLLGVVFMLAIAGADALNDRSSRRPFSWIELHPNLPFWAKRRTRRERDRVAMSVGKEA